MFSSKHLDELTAACQKITHLTGFLVRQQPYFRLYLQAKESKYPGIDPVGLGQNSGSTSKITHLSRVNDNYWQTIGL